MADTVHSDQPPRPVRTGAEDDSIETPLAGENINALVLLSNPLHPIVSFNASTYPVRPLGAPFPPAPDELTLRVVQFIQACWDSGRPVRREAALANGMFEGDFEKLDASSTSAATAISRSADAQIVDISASAGGALLVLVKHSYRQLVDDFDVCVKYRHLLSPEVQEKFASASAIEQVSLHLREFDNPAESAVHKIRRETTFLQSPYSPDDLATRAAALKAVGVSPIPPDSALLQSPTKRRLADIQQQASSSGTSTPPPTSSRRANPFAVAHAVDERRNWDPIKVPCGLKRISKSSVDADAMWALSEQGTPYASVQVPLSDPPARDWVRVSSGHVDADSVAGKVTERCHVGSFSTISCGRANAVWGISQDSIDNGRCVARIGFTRDTPIGTDWVNMSDGIMLPPPSASARADALMAKRSAGGSQRSQAGPTRCGQIFKDVSVGADGSVWAVVMHQEPVMTSVWVRHGARDSCLGSHWTPLAIQQESFAFERPHDASKSPRVYQFLKVTHTWFNEVFSVIAETAGAAAAGYGSIYERCGVSHDNLRGTCWRKVVVDPAPGYNAIVAPVMLSAYEQRMGATTCDSSLQFRTCSNTGDGCCWAVDCENRVCDLSAVVQRNRANPTATVIHDTFPWVDQHRDVALDADLVDGARADFTPLIRRFRNRVSGDASISLTVQERRDLWSVKGMLDASVLKTLFPPMDSAWDTEARSCELTDVITLECRSSSDAEGVSRESLLHFFWRVYDDAPRMTIILRVTPRDVVDPLLLQPVTRLVAVTAKVSWILPGPHPSAMMRTAALTAAASGANRKWFGGGLQVLQSLVGSDFIRDVNRTTAGLSPPLCSWLHLNDVTAAVNHASASESHFGFESIVHRDLCPDENYWDNMELYHQTFRQLRCVQSRRTRVDTKMMFMGSSRQVTVASHALLGSPAASVAVLCSDFGWERHSWSSRGPPLSAIIAPAMLSRRNYVDNESLHEALQLRLGTTTPFLEPHALGSIGYQRSSLSRVFVDALDLVDSLTWETPFQLAFVAVANRQHSIFPEDHLWEQSNQRSTLPMQRDPTSCIPALLQPGLSVILRASLQRVLDSFVTPFAHRHGVDPATLTSFSRLATHVIGGPLSLTSQLAKLGRLSDGGADEGDVKDTILFSSCISSAVVEAERELRETNAINGVQRGLETVTRKCLLESGMPCFGIDLLGGCNKSFNAVSPLLDLVTCALVDMKLCLRWESEATEPHHTASKSFREGPVGSASSSQVPSDATMEGVLVFDSSKLRLLECQDDSDRATLAQWINELPPSFTAAGSIALMTASAGNGMLSFCGRTSLTNWCYRGNVTDQHDSAVAVLTNVHVEAILRETVLDSDKCESSLSHCLELVELRLTGDAMKLGMFFEYATVSYPVMDSPSIVDMPRGASVRDLFGPSALHLQRKCIALGEVMRSLRTSRPSRTAHSISPAAVEAATRTELLLDKCATLHNVTFCSVAQEMISAALPKGSLPLPLQRSSTSRVSKWSLHRHDADALVSGLCISLVAATSEGNSLMLQMCNETDLIVGPRDRSSSSTSVWVLRKVLPASLVGEKGVSYHPDPILRHGDHVVMSRPSGTEVQQATADGRKLAAIWRIEVMTEEAASDDGESAMEACWEPLRTGAPFQLVASLGESAPLSARQPLDRAPAHHVWRAYPAASPVALYADSIHMLIFGQPAVASINVLHPPSFVAQPSLICNVEGAFLSPLTPGGRPFARTAVFAITDLNSAQAGCGFQTSLTENISVSGSSAEGTHGETVIEHMVGFHLRDAAVRLLGLAAPCTASGLSDGLTGAPLEDSVLHVLASGFIPDRLMGSPTADHLTLTPKCLDHATGANSDGGGIPVNIVVEMPLFQASLLQVPPSSTVAYPMPPCDGAASRFSNQMEFVSAKLEGSIDCADCIARVESLVRSSIQRRAAAVVAFETKRLGLLERQHAETRYHLEGIQDHVEVERETHVATFQRENDEADEEAKQAALELQKTIRMQELAAERAERKPHKADFYRMTQGVPLAATRHQQTKRLLGLHRVAANKLNAAGEHLASISSMCNSASEAALATVSLAAATHQSQSFLAALDPQLGGPIDERVLWALSAVRFRAWTDPTSASQPSVACAEITIHVYRSSRGVLPKSERNWRKSITSLDTIKIAPSSVESEEDANIKTGHRTAQSQGTQTSEEMVFVVPLSFAEGSPHREPLLSMSNFVECLVEPVARRVMCDIIATSSGQSTGVSAEIAECLSAVALK